MIMNMVGNMQNQAQQNSNPMFYPQQGGGQQPQSNVGQQQPNFTQQELIARNNGAKGNN